MSVEIFYRKVGKRYKPVSAYDSSAMDAFPIGAHLVVVDDGCRSIRYHVNPDHAGLLAAFRSHYGEMTKILREVTKAKLAEKSRPLTEVEKEAFEAWSKVMGDNAMLLEWPSIQDIVDALEKALIEKAKL